MPEDKGQGNHGSSDDDSSNHSGSSPHTRKRKKKEKKEKKSKHKKHKRDDGAHKQDKQLLKQAKAFLRSKLKDSAPIGSETASAGQPRAVPALVLQPEAGATAPEHTISADDYFLKNAEFTSYLLEAKGLYFNELSSEKSRSLFEEFVSVWNSGRLPARFYSGLVAAPMRRTTHKWQFKGISAAGKGSTGMAAFMQDEQEQARTTAELRREGERTERRQWNQNQRLLLDELLPKATGRDAAVEKRMARREDRKAREDSPDRPFLPGGGDVMGGDDSFAAAKAREARRAEWKQKQALAKGEELAQRRAEYEAAEAAKMAQFRALAAKGPISIPKRQDPP